MKRIKGIKGCQAVQVLAVVFVHAMASSVTLGDTTWTKTEVWADPPFGVGAPSLAFNASGSPAVAFATGRGGPTFAAQTGTGWQLTNIPGPGDAYDDSLSLAFSPSGLPGVAIYNWGPVDSWELYDSLGAHGFRDIAFFKLKIYALHETRYELVG